MDDATIYEKCILEYFLIFSLKLSMHANIIFKYYLMGSDIVYKKVLIFLIISLIYIIAKYHVVKNYTIVFVNCEYSLAEVNNYQFILNYKSK